MCLKVFNVVNVLVLRTKTKYKIIVTEETFKKIGRQHLLLEQRFQAKETMDDLRTFFCKFSKLYVVMLTLVKIHRIFIRIK